MGKVLIVIVVCLIFCNWSTAQEAKGDTINKVKKDSVSKEVPAAILELVREYDRQIKEAEARKKQQVVEPPTLEIDGIIIDETMSKSGREFYELFFSYWVKPQGYRNYFVKIKERPFRFNNTVIEVYLKEQLLYQQMMQRRFDAVEMMAKQAVGVVQRQIIKEIVAQRALIEQQQRLNK